MDIDPRLREPSHGGSQSYSTLPPPSYPLNPIRLPPPSPQQQQKQQQAQQPQQSAGLPQWPQDGGHPYYSYRPDQQPHGLPHPDLQPHRDPSFGSSQQGDGGYSESKRPRACEACRGLKVRCEPDPVKRTCRRCTKAGRTCVVTAPSRKRQKKTDSRVAELEKKIDALTASLHATKGQGVSDSDDNDSYDEVEQQNNDATGAGAGRKRRVSEYQQDVNTLEARIPPGGNNYMAPPLSGMPPDNPNIHPFLMTENVRPPPPPPSTSFSPGLSLSNNGYVDVVDRNVLGASTALDILSHYIEDMAPKMPIVVFPDHTAAEDIRKSTPVIFLAILSVASGRDHPGLQLILTKEITRMLADRIVCNGEKSLELIQALQVLTIWYWPEDDKDTKHYQLIHMAAIMAVDLGMGNALQPSKNGSFAQSYERTKGPLVRYDTIECRRAWLGCYLLCANAAVGLRKPNLIRWDSYLDECLHAILVPLGSPLNARASDKVLCQFVGLKRKADEFGQKSSKDEFGVMGISDIDTKTQDFSLSLALEFNHVNLSLHEIAINFDDGRVTSKGLHTQKGPHSSGKKSLEDVTSENTNALRICHISIDGILGSFSAFAPEDIRSIPNWIFAQVAYASILLIKLYFAASAPESDMKKDIPCDDMNVGQRITTIIDLLRASAEDGKSRPAHNFSLVMAMLHVWYEKQINDRAISSGAPVADAPEQKRQNDDLLGPPTEPKQEENHQHSRGPSTMDQTPLHLLSEVAMGNSGSSGHQIPNGGDSTHDLSLALASPGNAPQVDSHSRSMVGNGLRRMHPGFMQALGMTLATGDLNNMEDDGFFDLMQKTSNMFETNGG